MSEVERPPLSIQKAMAQNAEFFGFDLCDRIDIGGGDILEIVYRELLDAETKKRVDQVYIEYDKCDRHEIEYTNEEGQASKIQGAYKEPRQKDGQLFDLDEQVAVAVWGQERYDKYVAAGGPPGLVLMTWERMRRQIRKRAESDSKSS